jgi:hypothetical protein
MGNVVNLNRFKKQKARDTRASEADANRVKFGRTKAEKKLNEAEKELAARKLDGHLLDE